MGGAGELKAPLQTLGAEEVLLWGGGVFKATLQTLGGWERNRRRHNLTKWALKGGKPQKKNIRNMSI